MPSKSLKKFLISAGIVCVVAPAALAASVIMHRGQGQGGLGDRLQNVMEQVLLFGDGASPPAASVANPRSNAEMSAKGQIPLSAGPYLNGARLADLLRYNFDFSRLDLGDGWGHGGAAGLGAPGSATAALAGVLGVTGQQLALSAQGGASDGAGGALSGMAWSGAGPSGAGGMAGSGGVSGMGGGSGGSGSDPLVLSASPLADGTGSGTTGALVTVIPLPATVWMLLAAFGALGMAARRNGFRPSL